MWPRLFHKQFEILGAGFQGVGVSVKVTLLLSTLLTLTLFVCVCVFVCLYVYTHTCVCVYMCEFVCVCVFACVFVCEGRISLINSCNLGSVALTLPPLTRRLSAAPTSAIGRVQHLVLFSGGNLTAFDPAPVFAAILLPILPILLFTFPHYWQLGIKCRNWKVVDESTFRNLRRWVSLNHDRET